MSLSAENVYEAVSCNYVVGARIAEIENLRKKTDGSNHKQRVFQRLPRHMQRRAVSGNPKRLPHNLRNLHIQELKDQPKITKRPPKKYRKRPKSKVEEYVRRQQVEGKTWLESHVWHAKRFHMENMFGYVLPQRPTQKMYRPLLRAVEDSCTLQDQSFMCCLQLSGPTPMLVDQFRRITSEEGFHLLQSVCSQSAQHFDSLTLYALDSKQSIGDVEVMLIPSESDETNQTLWLWCHPSHYSQILDLLIQLYDLTKHNNREETMNSDTENDRPNPQSFQSEKKMKKRYAVIVDRMQSVFHNGYSNSSKGISVLSLKDTLCRFKLMGPLALAILKSVLVPSDISCKTEMSFWWTHHFSEERKNEILSNHGIWNNFPTNLNVENNVTIPLVVRDPRVMMPHHKQKHSSINVKEDNSSVPPLSNKWSPLFSSAVRLEVLQSADSDCEINAMRRAMALPGSELPLSETEIRLPVVVALHGTQGEKGSAVDLILPSGWATSMWIPLTYNGAVPSGVENQLHFMCEEFTPPLPYLLPDTDSGQLYAKTIARKRQTEYFNKPPTARVNFIKCNVQFPFSQPWSSLIASLENIPKEFSEDVCSSLTDEVMEELGLMKSAKPAVQVMRSGDCLRALRYLICKSGSRRRIFRGFGPLDKFIPAKDRKAGNRIPLDALKKSLGNVSKTGNDLVRCTLTVIGKGTIDACAMICRATAEDVRILDEKLKGGEILTDENGFGPIEESHCDENQTKRKEEREEHQKKLAKLRKLRKKARRDAVEKFSIVKCEDTDSKPLDVVKKEAVQKVDEKLKDIVESKAKYLEQKDALWLIPEGAPLQRCNRLVIGYVTEAAFSKNRGCSAGHGFFALKSLLPICQQRLSEWSNDSNDSLEQNLSGELESKAKRPKTEEFSNGFHVSEYGTVVDSSLSPVRDSGVVVLVRNINSLQYRYALLTISEKQPPP